jgi:type I restriction enzyme S subunit
MLDYKVPFDDTIVEKYSADMEPILNKIALNRGENAELSALRDWLLPLLMSGEVRVGG